MHGLVAWSLAVVATASLVALSVLVAGSETANGAVNGALATTAARNETTSPATAYWVDTLFRSPAPSTQAALAGRRYAQLDTGSATDGGTVPPEQPAITTDTTEPLPPTPPAGRQNPVRCSWTAPPRRPSRCRPRPF